MTTKKTYGNIPGVKVTTASGNVTTDITSSPDLSEHEYQLITIFIWMTLDIDQPRETFGGVDTEAAATALQCYGYDEYEALPMVWDTLEEIGRRCYTND